MIELELHFFLHRNGYFIYFTYGRFRHPERNDVIELSAHGRDEAGFVIAAVGQQGVGETFLVDFIFDDISRIQLAYFKHDLAGAPIDGAGRSRIVAGLCNVQVDYIAVGTVDGRSLELCESRQRVVIIFDDTVTHCSPGSLNFDSLADRK